MSNEIIVALPQNLATGGNSSSYDLPYNNMKFINDQIFLNTILFVYFISSAIIVGVYLYKMGMFDKSPFISEFNVTPLLPAKIQEDKVSVSIKKLEDKLMEPISESIKKDKKPVHIQKESTKEDKKSDLMAVD